jgi:hypothetical protein
MLIYNFSQVVASNIGHLNTGVLVEFGDAPRFVAYICKFSPSVLLVIFSRLVLWFGNLSKIEVSNLLLRTVCFTVSISFCLLV